MSQNLSIELRSLPSGIWTRNPHIETDQPYIFKHLNGWLINFVKVQNELMKRTGNLPAYLSFNYHIPVKCKRYLSFSFIQKQSQQETNYYYP